ncbi:FmdE family protein [Ectothiorhodospira mobilis]|uniref:FmdE family protein n=1 Tax=Ectothiorhodospira mobilis TaxID=195064 RepID=UPI001905D15A|nr:FmdE family protein [Ectothiorhodospira mobilis]MBK1692576.1 hypothetical protein [Ectothiorhodospira mobilis]
MPTVLRYIVTLPLFTVLLLMQGPLQGREADGAEAAGGTLPIKIIALDGEVRTATLEDVYRHHGHPCPPVTVTYLALRHALERLYDAGETPRAGDLAVLSPVYSRGAADVLERVLGAQHAVGSAGAPSPLTSAADLQLRVIRLSTGEGVNVRLAPGVWPQGWFQLRERRMQGEITPEETRRLRQGWTEVVQGFPGRSPQALFVEAPVTRVGLWMPTATTGYDSE